MTDRKVEMKDVYTEFKDVRCKYHSCFHSHLCVAWQILKSQGISKMRSKPVTRKYCFEQPQLKYVPFCPLMIQFGCSVSSDGDAMADAAELEEKNERLISSGKQT